MKKAQLFAGFSSLVLAAVLYLLGFTDINFIGGGTQVLVYPAAFFALAGLVLLFRAVRGIFSIADN
jgi:hypothetical protein